MPEGVETEIQSEEHCIENVHRCYEFTVNFKQKAIIVFYSETVVRVKRKFNCIDKKSYIQASGKDVST